MGAKRLTRSAICTIVLVVAGALTGCERASVTLVAAEHAKIRRVTDGDTVRLGDGRRVRLVQIDAPELGECHARASTEALERLTAPGQEVVLARDPSLDDHDAYGRLLRYVQVDGTGAESEPTVNVVLVRQGAAVPYFFHHDRGIHADELLAAAEAARRDRRGLWGACPGAKLDPSRGSRTGPGS